MVSFVRVSLFDVLGDLPWPKALSHPDGRDEDTDLKSEGQPAVTRPRPVLSFDFLTALR